MRSGVHRAPTASAASGHSKFVEPHPAGLEVAPGESACGDGAGGNRDRGPHRATLEIRHRVRPARTAPPSRPGGARAGCARSRRVPGVAADGAGPACPAPTRRPRRFGGPLPDEGLGTLAALDQLIEGGIDAHVRSSRTALLPLGDGRNDAGGARRRLADVAARPELRRLGREPAGLQARVDLAALAARAVRAPGRLGRRARHRRDRWPTSPDWQPRGSGGASSTAPMSRSTGSPGCRRSPILTSSVHPRDRAESPRDAGTRPRSPDDVRRPVGAMDLAAREHELRALDGAPAIVIAKRRRGERGPLRSDRARSPTSATSTAPGCTSTARSDCFARVSPRTAELAAGVERARLRDLGRPQVAERPLRLRLRVRPRPGTADPARSRPGRRTCPRRRRTARSSAYWAPELSRRARSLAVWATLARLRPQTATGRSSSGASTTPPGSRAQVEKPDDAELLRARAAERRLLPLPATRVAEDELDDLNERIARREMLTRRPRSTSVRPAGPATSPSAPPSSTGGRRAQTST